MFEVAAVSSQGTIDRVAGCVDRRVAEGVVGNLDVHRCFGRHIDVRAGVDPGEGVGPVLRVHSWV